MTFETSDETEQFAAPKSILEALGLDPEELAWQDFAVCKGMDTNLFYELYDDEQVAHMIDDACLSCPVMKQCIQAGTDNNEFGVWGAVYLNSGKPDENKNKFKTEEIWDEIKARLSETND